MSSETLQLGAELHARDSGSAQSSKGVLPSILLVDDEPGTVQVLGRMLSGMGHVRLALSGHDALRLAQESPPDVVLVDAEMPAMNGFEFCARLKAEPLLAEVPVIFITNHVDIATEVAGFAAGAADFIRKPPATAVVQARVRAQLRLKELTDALRDAALTDALTGVANRRRFDEDLAAESVRARRSAQPLSLLMIDVDFFKRYNDSYGHLVGDSCLRQVAEALSSTLHRPADRLARFGGEEFVALLPDTELAGASHVAERMIETIAALQIPHCSSPIGGIVTVSAGAAADRWMADAKRMTLSGTALISAADQALYEAKNCGRARCCVFRPEPGLGLAHPT